MLIKLFLFLFITSFAASSAAPAATITFFWDPNPPQQGVTGYNLYTLQGTARILRGSTPGTQLQVTLPDGIYTFAVTATNEVQESDLSNQLKGMAYGTSFTPLSKPTAPGSLRAAPSLAKITPGVRRGDPRARRRVAPVVRAPAQP